MSLSSQAYAKRYLFGCHAILKVGEFTGIFVIKVPVSTWAILTRRSSEAEASNLPSWENDMVRTGHSTVENEN